MNAATIVDDNKECSTHINRLSFTLYEFATYRPNHINRAAEMMKKIIMKPFDG